MTEQVPTLSSSSVASSVVPSGPYSVMTVSIPPSHWSGAPEYVRMVTAPPAGTVNAYQSTSAEVMAPLISRTPAGTVLAAEKVWLGSVSGCS